MPRRRLPWTRGAVARPAAPHPSGPVRSPVVLVMAGLLTAGLLGGCGESAVAPTTWAKSVCSALTPWHTKVASLTAQAQQEIDQTGTPVQTKQSLTALLAGAEEASEHARRRIEDAGVPDVAGGPAVADRFLTALARARDAYGHTRKAVAALDPSSEKPFYDAVEQAFIRLKDEYSASALDIETVGPQALHQAFDEVPECR